MVEIVDYEEIYKDQVVDLWIKVCVEEFGFTNWKDYITTLEHVKNVQDNGKFLVAIADEKVVGTISVENKGNNVGMLKGFYVDKDYRKYKIGFQLMNLLMEHIENDGYDSVFLETYEEFADAIRFYERYGFIRNEDYLDQIIYEKAI